jgi:hypothetical protein
VVSAPHCVVAASQLRLLELVVVEVVVVVVDVVVVTDTGGGVDALLGEAVGRGLTVGDDVPEVVMLTSAQFQNCGVSKQNDISFESGCHRN